LTIFQKNTKKIGIFLEKKKSLSIKNGVDKYPRPPEMADPPPPEKNLAPMYVLETYVCCRPAGLRPFEKNGRLKKDCNMLATYGGRQNAAARPSAG
jgi:hypothetical protein